MSGRAWPTSLEYVAAAQNPESAFRVPELRSARFIADAAGPKSIEGQQAIVFFGSAGEGPVAVRCLKRPLDGGAERYAALRAYLTDHPMAAIPSADWREDGIQVGGQTWPVIKMERVVGSSLLTFVEKNLADPARLSQVAAEWRALITELSRDCIAHGDLQQDNVMLADEEHLRLVDLDAVWLPTLSHLPPKERGHRHFQHPERLHTGYWGRYIDTFPALVIYVSLRALAADTGLFGDFNNDENLIFCDEDFARPGQTPLWPRLWASPDTGVRDVAHVLERCCQTTVQLGVDMDTLLSPGGFPATAASWTTPASFLASRPWWSVPPTTVLPPDGATGNSAATVPPPDGVKREWWLRESESAKYSWTRDQAAARAAPSAKASAPTPAKISVGSKVAIIIAILFLVVILVVAIVAAAH